MAADVRLDEEFVPPITSWDPAKVLEQVTSRLPAIREDIIPVISNLEMGVDNVPLKCAISRALRQVRAMPKRAMVMPANLNLAVSQDMLEWKGPAQPVWRTDHTLKT